MLTTGIRTPVGLKISGADFAEIDKIGTAIEAALPSVSGTRNVFAERTGLRPASVAGHSDLGHFILKESHTLIVDDVAIVIARCRAAIRRECYRRHRKLSLRRSDDINRACRFLPGERTQQKPLSE